MQPQLPLKRQRIMSISDFDLEEEGQDAPSEEAEDKKLEEMWSKKVRRRSSQLKRLVGDYLVLKEHPKITLLLTKNGERCIHFSDSVTKVNRKGRTQERWLMITDGALYNIDPTTVKVKRRIQLANISRLSASLLSDNFFVIHVPLEYDYLFVSGRKTEIITVLRQAFTEATSQELSITMQNIIDYRIDKDQQRRLVFQQIEGGVFTKIYAKKTK